MIDHSLKMENEKKVEILALQLAHFPVLIRAA